MGFGGIQWRGREKRMNFLPSILVAALHHHPPFAAPTVFSPTRLAELYVRRVKLTPSAFNATLPSASRPDGGVFWLQAGRRGGESQD